MISASYVFLCERLDLTFPEFRRKGACWNLKKYAVLGLQKYQVTCEQCIFLLVSGRRR